MKEPIHPLSKRNVLSMLGADLTIGTLVGWAANLIQVLTFQNGVLILSAIVAGTFLLITAQFMIYYRSSTAYIKHKLQESSTEKEVLQQRLNRLVNEFRLRSAVNPRPFMVEAYVNTRRFQVFNTQISVIHITHRIIEIDRGRADGIAYGMLFAVYLKGQIDCIANCQVDRIEETKAWLSLSDKPNLSNHTKPEDLILHPIIPIDLQEGEKQIGEILLIAKGLSE